MDFETSQVMTTQPSTINVDQLRVIWSRATDQCIFGPDENMHSTAGERSRATTQCHQVSWLVTSIRIDQIDIVPPVSQTSCSSLRQETKRGTSSKWSLTACIQSTRLLQMAGVPPSKIVVSADKSAGRQLSTCTRKVTRTSSGEGSSLFCAWFASGACDPSCLTVLFGWPWSAFWGPKSIAR